VSEATQKTDRVTWAFVGLLLVGAVVMGWQEVHSEILPGDSLAPAFEVERLSGGRVSLASLQGKVVVVNFWATWCPPCREEMPYLVQTVKDFERQGVTLVAISNDELDGQREVVSSFVAAMPALRPYAALGRPDVGFAYQVKALPSVYIIDREGRLVASHQGQASETQLRGWLEEALAAH